MGHTDWIDEYIELYLTKGPDLAIDFKSLYIPERLFKYVKMTENSLQKLYSLSEDSVWISGPENMDDIFDSGMTYNTKKVTQHIVKQDFDGFVEFLGYKENLTAEEIAFMKDSEDVMDALTEILIKRNPEKAEDLKKLDVVIEKGMEEINEGKLESFNNYLRSSIKLTCFSEANDSTLMWSKYGGEHNGYCIEFNFRELGLSDIRNRLLSPVKYTDEYFDATGIMTSNQTGVGALMATLAAFHKTEKDWSPLAEWRMVFPGGIIQIDQNYLMPVPKAIYLGLKLSDEHKQEILSIARLKKIPVFQMTASFADGKTKAKPVE